jgi:Skp family chaperone for outer membrane proteins
MKTALMKIIASRTLVFAAMLAGTLLFNASASAAEKEAAPVKIPDTVAAIWQSVDRETEGMAKEIQTGKLGELHQHAFAIRDLVGALPALSASMAADKLAKIKSDAKFVATLSQRLDAAGDGNNKAAAESNFEKLKEVLKAIRVNYSDPAPK